jgi:hypothetical protein
MSPGGDLPPLTMHRSAGDYYMGSGPIPPHVRGDFSQGSPRASPTATSPSLSSFGSVPHTRPSMTSNPYGPPQPLEPPANSDHRPNSVSGSPHMTSLDRPTTLLILSLLARPTRVRCLLTCTSPTPPSVDLPAPSQRTMRPSPEWAITLGRPRYDAGHRVGGFIRNLSFV